MTYTHKWTKAELALSPQTRQKILRLCIALQTGDKIAAIATPIARALRLPCIDRKTGQLKPTSGCAKRRDKLNQIT